MCVFVCVFVFVYVCVYVCIMQLCALQYITHKNLSAFYSFKLHIMRLAHPQGKIFKDFNHVCYFSPKDTP